MGTAIEGAAHRALGEASSPKSASKRWGALDLFRFTAVILMIQGHTFNVLVEEALRGAKWYRWHNYVHGYTAPMFMMASGLAFGITTFRTWEAHTRPTRAFWKRIERYSLIVGIGYYLHLPRFSVRALMSSPPDAVRAFLKVDALHVIGLTLLVTEVLALLVRRRVPYVVVIAALGLTTILLAPSMAAVDAGAHLPRALAAYVNTRTGSLFPIFPYTGFLCTGIATAHFVQGWLDRGEVDALGPRLAAIAGALFLFACVLFDGSPWGRGMDAFWLASPLLVAFRVGAVLLFLSLLCMFERALSRRWSQHGPLRRLLEMMGMETLVIYVAHLLILYGTPLWDGLHHAIGTTLTVGGAFAVFALIFVAMAIFAVSWHSFKKRRPSQFFVARMVLLGAAVLYALVAA